MLIYVSTYPRCGSGVLRRLIRLNFEYAVSNGHHAAKRKAVPTDDPALWYVKPPAPWHNTRYMVAEPAMETLTSATRERLAADPRRFFVKTHDLPFSHFFTGEAALQMVRHPAAAILSFATLSDHTIEQISAGDCFCGSWAAYHAAWRQADLPVARVRYEDNYIDPFVGLHALEGLIGEVSAKRAVETPEEATRRAPERNPGNGPYGWREKLSAKQIARIWSDNGEEASHYGYLIDA